MVLAPTVTAGAGVLIRSMSSAGQPPTLFAMQSIADKLADVRQRITDCEQRIANQPSADDALAEIMAHSIVNALAKQLETPLSAVKAGRP